MRKYTFFSLFLLSFGGFGQTFDSQKLRGEWIKTNITLTDGSPIYSADFRDSQLYYDFFSPDSVLNTINGKSRKLRYQIQDSILVIEDVYFKIKELSDIKLIINQLPSSSVEIPIQISLIPQRVHRVGFRPESYIAKNGERVYISDNYHLVPIFLNSQKSAMTYIYEKFAFPDWRRALFIARAIVTKSGQLTGVRIEESTQPKYNQKLIDAIVSTKGSWLPAKLDNQPINTEVIFRFDLGWTKTNASQEEETAAKRQLAEELFQDGSYFMTLNQPKLAIESLTEAIANDHLLVKAYYQRAAAYIATKRIDKACLDYKQLLFLEQKQAQTLYDTYCKSLETDKK